MLEKPNEAEQNRLIQIHMSMVTKIAADYRGRKGIPFEELEAQGMLGLVMAARMWEPRAKFSTYATDKIRSAIVDFIDRWQHLVLIDEYRDDDADEERIHEWDIWGGIPYEGWTGQLTTPEQFMEAYESVAENTAALEAALMSLSRREKWFIHACCIKKPALTRDQAARDYSARHPGKGVSYWGACKILDRATAKLREVVKKIEINSQRPPRHASKRITDQMRTLGSSGYSGRKAGAPIKAV
jgi:RNA polymerase sigma factor (sigma-70 family)